MKYSVVLLPRAERQLYDAALWWAEYRDPEQAFRWLKSFSQALLDLSDNPKRYAYARENGAFSIELRQLNYGLGSRPTHRAVFEVRSEEEVVLIYSIRHLAQDDISLGEL